MPSDFRIAYARVHKRIGEDEWLNTSESSRANIFFAELRSIGIEIAAQNWSSDLSKSAPSLANN